MKIVDMKCPNCGGELEVDKEKDVVICEYCHSQFMIEEIMGKKQEQEKKAPTVEAASRPRVIIEQAPSNRHKTSLVAMIVLIIIGAGLVSSFKNMQIDKWQSDWESYQAFNNGGSDEYADSDSDAYDDDYWNDVEEEPSEDIQLIKERIFGKDIEAITEEDLDKVRYIKVTRECENESNSIFINHTTVYYSFEDYYSAQDPESYLENLKQVEIYQDSSEDTLCSDDFACFKELTYLGYSNVNTETIRKLPNLKGISGYCDELSELEEVVDPSALIELHLDQSCLFDEEGLKDIGDFNNLEVLEIAHAQDKSLEPVLTCEQLKSLSLYYDDQIKDYQLVKQFPLLESLSINGGNVKDMSYIKEMPNLKALHIEGTKIKNIEWLKDNQNLRQLELIYNTELTSIDKIGTLTQLEALSLDVPEENMDLSWLGNLTQLKKLRINQAYGDVSYKFFSKLGNLERLTLTDCDVHSGLACLAPCKNLKYLKLTGLSYECDNFGQLAALSNLKELDLSENSYSNDISSLFKITSLEKLNLADTSAPLDLSQLKTLTQLKTLNLNHMRVYVVLADTDDAWSSSYEQGCLDDYREALGACKSLETLEIAGEEISSLDFISELTQLNKFNFINNYVTDIAPLADCSQLTSIVGNENPVSDWEGLTDWTYDK